jgi:uncharacterized repeat protein (TIGR01451 family)
MLVLASIISFVVLAMFAVFGLLTPPASAVQAQIVAAQKSPAACTIISGDITTDTTWSDPCYHIVTNTVAIQPGVVLTIVPDVRVEFDPGARLGVQGRLLVLGQPDHLITFTAWSPPQHWQSIFVYDNPAGAYINFALVEYADTGVVINDTDYVTITHSIFRYVGNGTGYTGAIGGDTDNSLITDNLIYSATNGIVLNESFYDQLLRNTIRDTTGYGLALIRKTTEGGSNNTLADNVISNTLRGLWLENGGGNRVLNNSLTLNQAAAVYLSEQSSPAVSANNLHDNGGDSAYRAAIVITGSNSLPLVTSNVVLDTNADAVALDASANNSFSIGSVTSNALCSIPALELRNDSITLTVNASSNWWGTNTPQPGVEYSGLVNPATPIVLSMTIAQPNLLADGTSSTIVTVTLRDLGGHTVSPPNRPGDVNARLIKLQASLGSISSTAIVDDSGVATATLLAGTTVGSGLITATAFCDYPLTATFSVTPTNLAVRKQAFTAGAEPGVPITYLITYSNTSTIAAPNVVLTDTLPAGMDYVTDTSKLPVTLIGNQVVWPAGELPANSLGSFVLTTSVRVEAQWCGRDLTNTLRIATSAVETSLADNVAATQNSIKVLCADWSIAKRADRAEGLPDAPIDFTIIFTNGSVSPLTGVTITDVLPAETQFVSANPMPTSTSGNIVTWKPADVFPPGQPVTLTLSLIYTGTSLNAWLTNSVTITSPLEDMNPANNTAQAAYHVFGTVDLGVSKTGDKRVAHPGDQIVYTIGITNQGSYTATNVVLTETLPLSASYVGYAWTSVAAQTYVMTISHLAPGESQFRLFVVGVLADAVNQITATNTVCGWAAQGDADPTDNCATYETRIEPNRVYLPIILKPAPRVYFVTDTLTVPENIGAASIGVMLDRAASQVVTVTCSTANGSALAGQDYTATVQSIEFPVGQVGPLPCSVGIIDDTLSEPDETFGLALSNPQNADLGAPSQANITIVDNDACLTVTADIPSYYSPMDLAYDAGTDRLFIANRDGMAGGSISVTHVSPVQHIVNITGVLSAQGIVYDTARHLIFAAGWDWLDVLDANTYTRIATVTMGNDNIFAHSIAYNPNNQKVYVTGYDNNNNNNTITVIDVSNAMLPTILTQLTDTAQHPLREPAYVVVSLKTNKVYVANHNGGNPTGWVTIIDGTTNQIIKTLYLDPAGELYGLAIDDVHDRIFVTGIGVANVYAINGALDEQDPPNKALKITRSNGQAIPLRMIAVNPAPDPGNPNAIRLWLTSSSTEQNGLDQLIAVTGEWITMSKPFLGIAMPPSPERGLRFDPTTNFVFVASASANRVTVVRDDSVSCLNPLRPTSEQLSVTVVDTSAPVFTPERWWAR